MGKKNNNPKLSPISLCVGGTSFITSYHTLKPALYLKRLIDGPEKDVTCINENEIFIDRSGRLFEYVLQYLRAYDFQDCDTGTLRELLVEAEYFEIQSMISKVMEKLDAQNQKEHFLLDINELKNISSLSERKKSTDALISDQYDVISVWNFDSKALLGQQQPKVCSHCHLESNKAGRICQRCYRNSGTHACTNCSYDSRRKVRKCQSCLQWLSEVSVDPVIKILVSKKN